EEPVASLSSAMSAPGGLLQLLPNVRTYATSWSTCSGVKESLKGSIPSGFPSLLKPSRMAFFMSPSLTCFCQPAVVMSGMASFAPVSVLALPSTPWQLAHLAFQVRTVFGSVSAEALRGNSAANANALASPASTLSTLRLCMKSPCEENGLRDQH